MKIPRQYEPDKEEAFGNESWAKKFIYPNGWTMDSYKKVVLKDGEEDWYLTRPTHSKSPVFWVSAFLLLLFVLRLLWTSSFVIS
jgi:hypothetical protein